MRTNVGSTRQQQTDDGVSSLLVVDETGQHQRRSAVDIPRVHRLTELVHEQTHLPRPPTQFITLSVHLCVERVHRLTPLVSSAADKSFHSVA